MKEMIETLSESGLAKDSPIPWDVENRLVFWNGQYVAPLSRTKGLGGIKVEPCSNQVGLSLPDRTTLEEPLYLHFFSDSEAILPFKNLITIGEGSRLVLVEGYAGATPTTVATEVTVGPEGIVDHYRVQGDKVHHRGSLRVRQARQSRLNSHSIVVGAESSRTDIDVLLMGEGTESTLNGFYFASGNQEVDHHTSIDHTLPHGQSQEIYKGILAGRAHGVFNGRIVVQPSAQKTNARQTNRNLLLSDDAVMDTRPVLEIHANDVKCNHGATIGRLDHHALFYLRSRGLGDREARRLLIFAFADEMIEKIGVPPLRSWLRDYLGRRLEQVALGQIALGQGGTG